MLNDSKKIQPNMIDSHFHILEMTKKELNIENELKICTVSNMSYMLEVGTKADDLHLRTPYAVDNPQLLFSAGIHPFCVKNANNSTKIQNLITILEEEITNSPIKICAIGECGADFFHDFGDSKLQQELFERQIDLANRLSLPIIVHSRNADKIVKESLSRNRAEHGGIMHCFGSDKIAAFNYIDLGFKISFAGNITYKKSEMIQDVAKKIPSSSILVETDSPYLTPQPMRKFFNRPEYISYTYEKIAIIRNQKIDIIIKNIEENFKNLFNIK